MPKEKQKPIAEIKGGVVYILQAGTPVFIKTADVCALTGKSNQWIGQLTSQGTIFKKKTSHGSLYELAPTIRAYVDMLGTRAEKKDKTAQELEKEKLEGDARYKQAKATLAEFDAKEREGKMHRSEDVAALTEDLIFAIRGALLALIGRLAIDVPMAKDQTEAEEIIRKEVYKVMEDLSGYRYDAAKYQERVRERMKLEASEGVSDDDES